LVCEEHHGLGHSTLVVRDEDLNRRVPHVARTVGGSIVQCIQPANAVAVPFGAKSDFEVRSAELRVSSGLLLVTDTRVTAGNWPVSTVQASPAVKLTPTSTIL
jgi:hypothetical protein